MNIKAHQITATDGASASLYLTGLEINELRANSDLQARPIILCMPAMGVPARKYLRLAETLNQSQLISAILEWRGIDTSSLRANKQVDFGYADILQFDLPAAIAFIRQHYPQNPIYLLGHSLGGQLSVLYMSLNPQQIKGFIGVATGTPHFKAWSFPHNIGLRVMSLLMPLIANFHGHFPGRKLGFGGREARRLIADWAYSVKTGNYRMDHSGQSLETKIAELTQPGLLITIDNDVLAPPESIKSLGNKMQKADLSYQHVELGEIDAQLLGHFNWMKQPQFIVDKVHHWLQSLS